MLGRPTTLIAIVFLLVAGVAGADEFEGKDADAWTRELANPRSLQRPTAARALWRLHACNPPQVAALVHALEDHEQAVEFRILVIGAIGSCGRGATSALPLLLATLNDPEDTEDSVRGNAAEALGHICTEGCKELALALSSPHASVRAGAAQALATVGKKALPAADLLIHQLVDVDENSRTWAGHALRSIGELALPKVIAAGSATNPQLRLSVVTLVGHMGIRSKEVGVLLRARLAELNDSVSTAAAHAIGELEWSGDFVEPLSKVLLRGSAVVRASAFWALGQESAWNADVAKIVTHGLSDVDGIVRSRVFEVLQARALIDDAAVVAELKSGTQPDTRASAARLLARAAPTRDTIRALVVGLADVDATVNEASFDTLMDGSFPAASVEFLPQIIESLSLPARTEEEVELVGEIADYVSPDRREFQSQLERLLRIADGMMSDLDGRIPRAQGRLRRAVDRFDRERRHARATMVAGTLATAIAVLLGIVASVRLRRRILLFLGRRWRLVPGSCDIADVLIVGDMARIEMRPHDAAAAREMLLLCPGNVWPPADATNGLATTFSLAHSTEVLLVVEEELFPRPWVHLLSPRWSEAGAAIAGQVVVRVPNQGERRQSGPKTLSFAAIGESRAPDLSPLHNVQLELAAVARSFRRWGASTKVLHTISKIAFEGTLATHDVVHVVCHATPASLHLSDGIFGAADTVRIENIRCRLLVLSACSAGALDAVPAPLVRAMVVRGVNVLATTLPLDSTVGQMFFESFYDALLPRKAARGISLAEAIRLAVGSCRERLKTVPYPWEREIDALILFGDPSMELSLIRSV